MLFGAKCHKCGCPQPPVPCNACNEAGEDLLPETITVTFSDMPDKIESRSFVGLSVTGCMGQGAAGVALSPLVNVGDPGGPLADIVLTSGGSGYARLGRVAPELTLSVTNSKGYGVEVQGSFSTPTKNACGCNDLWTLTGLTITNPGQHYADFEVCEVVPLPGSFMTVGSSGRVRVQKNIPTLSVSTPYSLGTGAEFQISYETTQYWSPIDYSTLENAWAISSVVVTNGGSGYGDWTPLSFDVGEENVIVYSPTCYVRTVRVEPSVQLTVPSLTGQGVSLRATFNQQTGIFNDVNWILRGDTVVVDEAGSGYVVGDQVDALVVDGSASANFAGYVSQVSPTGGVLEVQHTQEGSYFKDTGVLGPIAYLYGGVVYSTPGEITQIILQTYGTYYKEDPEAEPCVAEVTVGIGQTFGVGDPNNNSASATATVDVDPTSETFGQVTEITLDNPGDNYIARYWIPYECCGEFWQQKPFVLQQFNDYYVCSYYHGFCWLDASIIVTFGGIGNGVSLSYGARGTCGGFGNTTKPVKNCLEDEITLEGSTTEGPDGTKITISPGGKYRTDWPPLRQPDYASITLAWNGHGKTFSADPFPLGGANGIQAQGPWVASPPMQAYPEIAVWAYSRIYDATQESPGSRPHYIDMLVQLRYVCPCYYDLLVCVWEQFYLTKYRTTSELGWPEALTFSRTIFWSAEVASGDGWPSFGDFKQPWAITPFKPFLHRLRDGYGWETNMLRDWEDLSPGEQNLWMNYQSRGLYPTWSEAQELPEPPISWNIGWR